MTFDMVLQNCRLIPELSGGWDGGLADIAVSGGFIQAVEKAGSGMQGRNAVDCYGKTLLPGLYDIHQHSDAVTANFMDNWAMDEYELFNRSLHGRKKPPWNTCAERHTGRRISRAQAAGLRKRHYRYLKGAYERQPSV